MGRNKIDNVEQKAVHAAYFLCLQGGLSSISGARVAKIVGVSESAIFKRFKTKNEFIHYCYLEAFSFLEDFSSSPFNPFSEKLNYKAFATRICQVINDPGPVCFLACCQNNGTTTTKEIDSSLSKVIQDFLDRQTYSLQMKKNPEVCLALKSLFYGYVNVLSRFANGLYKNEERTRHMLLDYLFLGFQLAVTRNNERIDYSISK